MSDTDKTGWTLSAYIAHNEAMRAAEEKFQQERDRRYSEKDAANKEALKVASANAEKLSDKIEQALKEYKEGANEWRKTVSDLIASQQGGKDTWARIIAIASVAASAAIYFKG